MAFVRKPGVLPVVCGIGSWVRLTVLAGSLNHGPMTIVRRLRQNYAQDAASYQDYMTNPEYATIREYSQATRSVVDKVTTALGV